MACRMEVQVRDGLEEKPLSVCEIGAVESALDVNERVSSECRGSSRMQEGRLTGRTYWSPICSTSMGYSHE